MCERGAVEEFRNSGAVYKFCHILYGETESNRPIWQLRLTYMANWHWERATFDNLKYREMFGIEKKKEEKKGDWQLWQA